MNRPVPVVVEVTNTLLAPTVTGYQRFVRELLAQLDTDGSPALEVVTVVWDAGGGCYRRLTPTEATVLRESPVPRPAPSVGGAHGVLVSVGRTRLGRRALRACRAALRAARSLGGGTPEAALTALRLTTLPAGAVFFDIEPAWHDPMSRARLLPELRALDITVVTMVADVMPELHPEWFEPRIARLFHDWLASHLHSAQLLLTISANTAVELREVARRDGVAPPPIQVVPLGADFCAPDADTAVPLPEGMGRYLLMVGTVEPRKNHALALDMFDLIVADHTELGLVLVGKQGWLTGDTVQRIRSHPLFGTRLIWLTGADDRELAWLYRHAFMAITPSLSEGLGLPVMEAMHYGVPTVSATGGALPEAGGSIAEYADARDPGEWERLIRAHLDDDTHHEQSLTRTRAYVPPTWAAAGQAVRRALAMARAADTSSTSEAS